MLLFSKVEKRCIIKTFKRFNIEEVKCIVSMLNLNRQSKCRLSVSSYLGKGEGTGLLYGMSKGDQYVRCKIF